jgi:hypothetical protein
MTFPEMDALLLDTVFAPREDEDEMRIDAGLHRALTEVAEECRIDAAEILAEADIEIARAQAAGTDRYPGDDR